jgi:hypothetical protein
MNNTLANYLGAVVQHYSSLAQLEVLPKQQNLLHLDITQSTHSRIQIPLFRRNHHQTLIHNKYGLLIGGQLPPITFPLLSSQVLKRTKCAMFELLSHHPNSSVAEELYQRQQHYTFHNICYHHSGYKTLL